MTAEESPTCTVCGSDLEFTDLKERVPPSGNVFGVLMPPIVSSATLCCPKRCDVDMTFYREMTPEEAAAWRMTSYGKRAAEMSGGRPK